PCETVVGLVRLLLPNSSRSSPNLPPLTSDERNPGRTEVPPPGIMVPATLPICGPPGLPTAPGALGTAGPAPGIVAFPETGSPIRFIRFARPAVPACSHGDNSCWPV